MQSFTGLHARLSAIPKSPSPHVTEYFIPNHVHFALEGDAAVFMDLRSDQYSMLLGEKALAFKALVSPAENSFQRVIRLEAPKHSSSDTQRQAVVAELLAHGLVTTDLPEAPNEIPACIPLPEENLLEPGAAIPIRVTTRDLYAFLASCVTAKWRLSFATIEHTVRAIERRKRLRCNARSLDVTTARTLVGIYSRLRPLVPQNYLCLFDSLSLLEFLARYDCFPSWIFAIHLEPWAAHCWVQYGTISFNTDIDEARTYLPILCV